MKINHLLNEAANPKVGRKYQHIEDLVLSDGSNGAMHAIERLKHMGEEGGSIELKWDGMPVVYWGRDSEGNFSMFPKNAWAYLKRGQTETSSGAPTVMRSPKDVQAFVLGTGGGDPKARQAFANQFASLWPYFEKISPKLGYLEGGLLFYPGTKPDGESAMPVLNRETNTYDFTPNITTFHIPVDSDLGKQISTAKMMVAATGYFATMGSSDEERFPDAQKLSVPGIIVQGTTYVQDPVELDTQGLANMEAFVKKNAKLIDGYLAPKPGLSNPGGELYSYLNKHLRTEGLLSDFPVWANGNLSPKKAQTLLSDPKGLQATLGAVEGITKQKNILINQLSQGLHGGIKQTKPEGYAQAHPGKPFKYDIPGQFIKTIDQTNWSPKESVVKESKGGKKAVIGWGRGMGHTGHDALVTSVIHQAENTGSTPFFVVSRSFGKDDPIPPETKVKMYQKKFPKYAKMFSLPPEGMTTLNEVLANLATKGFTDVTLIVGEQEKAAFGYLTRPAKDGIPPYQKFGLNSLQIMSRQDTKAPGSDPTKPDYHEGPRATPMREVLTDPNGFRASNPDYANMSDDQMQYTVWRQAMNSALSDQEVLQMMNTAKENLAKFNMPKPKGRKLKEFIERVKPLLEHATSEQKVKIYNQLLEAKKQLNELGEPSSNNLANKVALLIHSRKPEIFSRYGDEKVMNMIIDTCTDNLNKTEMELAIEALNRLKTELNEGLLDRFIKPKMKMNIEKAGNELYVDVTLGGKQIAGFTFDHFDNDLIAQDMSVFPEYRGKGIAKWVYDSLKSQGYNVHRSPHQTDAGAHFWDKNKGGGSKVWEQGVAEGSSEIKIPTEDGITMQDIRLMAGEGPLTKKTILQAIAVIRKQRRPQGVAEDKESDPVTNAVLSFYKPVVNDIHKEKLPDYVDQARDLLHQTNDPEVRSKLIDIFKKGKENPYIQGGIVTTVGALLAGGILTTAQRMGLSPAQTNLALQAILNTVIPTVVSRINGKNWSDTIKYTLASAGIGTGIAGAGLLEDSSLSVEELAQISDKALDDAYHYGRSTPGANFGWMANLQSAKAAKRLIDAGETDIEKISDAIHQGWNVTAAADYKGQLQLDIPTPDEKKLKRAKLAMQSYAQLPEEEKEKDRVVARALLSALGKTNVTEVLNTKPNKINKSTWSEQTEDLVKLNFVASNGIPYDLSITALYMSPDEIQDSVPEEIPDEIRERGRFVEFIQEVKPGAGYGKQGIEGTGAAAEILAIVYNGLSQYIKKHKPTFLMFQAAEPSRRRLYSTLVKKMLQTMPNWKYTENDGIFFVYDTRYIKQGMEEGFGIPQPGTYEETHMMKKPYGHRTFSLTTETNIAKNTDYIEEK